jgi:uncharacterized damage-inducible protein DinB
MKRVDPDDVADERTGLVQWLEFHRATLLDKVAGLDQAGLSKVATASGLTLAGLVRHLSFVEDHWFTVTLRGWPQSEPWASADWTVDPDWEIHSAIELTPDELRSEFLAACERSRLAMEGIALDALSVLPRGRTGQPVDLRWVLLHMIEEIARHNGHADILRELTDGATGD